MLLVSFAIQSASAFGFRGRGTYTSRGRWFGHASEQQNSGNGQQVGSSAATGNSSAANAKSNTPSPKWGQITGESADQHHPDGTW